MKKTLVITMVLLGIGGLLSLSTTADDGVKNKAAKRDAPPATDRDAAGDRPKVRREGDSPRRRPETRRKGDRPGRPEAGREGDRPRGRAGSRREGDRRPEGRPGSERGRPGDRGPGGPPRVHPLIMIFDTNRDGVLSAEEINNVARVLKQMDRNRDGKLTSDEMPRPRFGPGGSRGEPGRSERGRPGEADRDGKARPERPGQADRPRRSEGQRRRGGDQAPSPERFLQRFDRNKDGKVQASELPEGLKRLFERGDTNQDGELDRAEIAKLLERFRPGQRRPESKREGGGQRPERPARRGDKPRGDKPRGDKPRG